MLVLVLSTCIGSFIDTIPVGSNLFFQSFHFFDILSDGSISMCIYSIAYKSERKTRTGSPFIRALVLTLCRHAHQLDIEDMAKIVSLLKNICCILNQ